MNEILFETTSVITPLFEVFTVDNAVVILTGAASISVGLAFMWWGVRKLVHVLMSAFKRGKVSL